jgi:hypothetical protein
LCPAGFVEVVVVVHPGLPLQVLVLPPWVEVSVVTKPFFWPAASAALEANANEPTSRRAISRVMGFLLYRLGIHWGLNTEWPSPPIWVFLGRPGLQAAHYLHCPAGPSHVDDVVDPWKLWPPLFSVVDVVVVVVVHPVVLWQVFVLPPWPLVVVVVVVVTNPFLFPLVLSASTALEANAHEPATRRAKISRVMDTSCADRGL